MVESIFEDTGSSSFFSVADTSTFETTVNSLETGDSANVGSAFELGLNSFTLGLGTTLSDLLGLDLDANIDNVLKYGFDSWGASSSPDQIAVDIQNEYLPIIKSIEVDLGNSTSVSILTANLNKLEQAIKYYACYGKASNDRRSWASSTEAANDFLTEYFVNYYNESFQLILSALTDSGFTITKLTSSSNFGDLDHLYHPSSHSGNTTAEKNGSFSHYTYEITSPTVDLSTKTETVYVNGVATTVKSVEPVTSTNTMMMWGLGLLLLFMKPIRKTLKF